MNYNLQTKENAIVLAAVSIGEKVFIRFNGAIHQAKVLGFITRKGDSCCAKHSFAFRYLLHLGRNKDLWFDTFQLQMYRTIEDAMDNKEVNMNDYVPSLFAKRYLKGRNYFLSGYEIHGYKWNGFEPVETTIINPIYRVGIRYVNGKADIVNINYDAYERTYSVGDKRENPDDTFYQTAEDCKEHNAPTIVMLDDED